MHIKKGLAMHTKTILKSLTLVLLIAVNSIAGEKQPKTEKLIKALIVVESNGNDKAIGDRGKHERAYGCLQIRKPCVDDVNRKFGTKYKAEDTLGNRQLSLWICQKYLELYATEDRLGKKPEAKDLARIWNGGPTGHKKQATLVYWNKVEKVLGKMG